MQCGHRCVGHYESGGEGVVFDDDRGFGQHQLDIETTADAAARSTLGRSRQFYYPQKTPAQIARPAVASTRGAEPLTSSACPMLSALFRMIVTDCTSPFAAGGGKVWNR